MDVCKYRAVWNDIIAYHVMEMEVQFLTMNLKKIHVIIWTSVPNGLGVTWQINTRGNTWPCCNKVDTLFVSGESLWTRVGGALLCLLLRIFDHLDIEHEVTERIWDHFYILCYLYRRLLPLLCHSSIIMQISRRIYLQHGKNFSWKW